MAVIGGGLCRDVRASTLEQSLRNLGVEKLSKDDIAKMPWESLEGKIKNWIQYMRIAVRIMHYHPCTSFKVVT